MAGIREAEHAHKQRAREQRYLAGGVLAPAHSHIGKFDPEQANAALVVLVQERGHIVWLGIHVAKLLQQTENMCGFGVLSIVGISGIPNGTKQEADQRVQRHSSLQRRC